MPSAPGSGEAPRAVRADFAVIDSRFPQRVPYAFRNAEIVEYLRRFTNVTAFAMPPTKPGPEAWFAHGYGVSREEFRANKQGFLSVYPDLADRIRWLNPDARYEIGLAYSFFLAETYTLLPFYAEHRVPFVFVLYPGGAFGLDNPSSDAMLRQLFGSDLFRGVIVTQEVTRTYLLDRGLCPADRIHFVFGGFSQFRPADVAPKVRFPDNKETFDVCFVAAKYSPEGADKGYDVVVRTAQLLAGEDPPIRFHIVGNFNSTDVALEDAAPVLTFHGVQPPSYLREFFSRMDVFLSPNRPGLLYPGQFDGFPLGGDAASCGVALLVADPLELNTHFRDRVDLMTIPPEPETIAKILLDLKDDPERLHRLAASGQTRTADLFSIDRQIGGRVEVSPGSSGWCRSNRSNLPRRERRPPCRSRSRIESTRCAESPPAGSAHSGR